MQADALRAEGVEVQQDAMGKFSVDLAEYGWFPPVLPSDLAELRGEGEQQAEQAAQVDWGEVQDRDERDGKSDL